MTSECTEPVATAPLRPRSCRLAGAISSVRRLTRHHRSMWRRPDVQSVVLFRLVMMLPWSLWLAVENICGCIELQALGIFAFELEAKLFCGFQWVWAIERSGPGCVAKTSCLCAAQIWCPTSQAFEHREEQSSNSIGAWKMVASKLK